MDEKLSTSGGSWDFWGLVDEFLMKERDAFQSTVTHIHLASAAITIVSVLLSIYSFLNPLVKISQMDRKELEGGLGLFVIALALTIGAILCIILYAISRVRRQFIRSLKEELLLKAKAIHSTSEHFELALPSATINLLKSIETL